MFFHFLKNYYIRDFSVSPYPIDEIVFSTGRLFEPACVISAKSSGYYHARYYVSFFPADMIFPVIYSLLFLSAISGMKKNVRYHLFLISIMAGWAFDYLEDVSFAFFLSARGDELAPVVAFFTTIKSFVFVINMIIFTGCLLYYRENDNKLKK